MFPKCLKAHIVANGTPTNFLIIKFKITTFGAKALVVLVGRVNLLQSIVAQNVNALIPKIRL